MSQGKQPPKKIMEARNRQKKRKSGLKQKEKINDAFLEERSHSGHTQTLETTPTAGPISRQGKTRNAAPEAVSNGRGGRKEAVSLRMFRGSFSKTPNPKTSSNSTRNTSTKSTKTQRRRDPHLSPQSSLVSTEEQLISKATLANEAGTHGNPEQSERTKAISGQEYRISRRLFQHIGGTKNRGRAEDSKGKKLGNSRQKYRKHRSKRQLQPNQHHPQTVISRDRETDGILEQRSRNPS
ncbi:hypothetical protein C922_05499 [Plasmodium inui San Antonio 1]|uniref:Uncharacterized protein n=1 Tax=Plasmodium inui San Antonio 1 TaxID=1237626 RepID=W6ZXT8_9APIC|nr:hypothetical protein C922_05499 [Plasmodium inui San Antonio 1]EUD64118.1 hypothetical protein C922_05499 [Plasmodium inui San Antonio 1]